MLQENSLLIYIGKKIKLYRKLKQMSVDTLAELIHKSRATVAKYEKGKIAIDIITLAEIGRALHVDLKYLLDYKSGQSCSPYTGHTSLFQMEYLYLYRIEERKVQNSILHVLPNNNPKLKDAVLYYHVKDGKNIETSTCVYHGVMKNYENLLNFTLYNYYNSAETIMLNVGVPMRRVDYLTGMMQGISSNTLRPINFKVIMKLEPWNKSTEELRNLLAPSREILKDLCVKNMMRVDS